jgi:hypothetical protein
MTDNSNAAPAATQGANNSTLIEFPGPNRNRPAWRKELSERFREIQQRRAREAALEEESAPRAVAQRVSPEPSDAAAQPVPGRMQKQLGLVPPPDEPEMNPIVVAALRRIERARKTTSPPATHTSPARSHGAATAAARVVEEQPEYLGEATPARRPAPARQPEGSGAAAHASRALPRADKSEAEGEQARASSLVVVPPKPAKPEPKPEPAAPARAAAPAPQAAQAAAEAGGAAKATVEPAPAAGRLYRQRRRPPPRRRRRKRRSRSRVTSRA